MNNWRLGISLLSFVFIQLQALHDEPNPPPIKDSQGQASRIGETDENARLVGENEDKSYSSSSGGLNTPSSEESIEEKRKYLNNTTTWVLF